MKAAQQAEASFAAERKRVEKLTETLQKLQDDTEIALQNGRQTVSLLVTEKVHLTTELQKRADFESSRYLGFLHHIGFLMKLRQRLRIWRKNSGLSDSSRIILHQEFKDSKRKLARY